jgi:two-component system alkaline phosphatase synthesis response regulator PhoP
VNEMNESILIVEDEKALRTTLSDRLRTEGYVVDTAADGIEAVDKATNQPFDLIILDIMLPRRGGLDVCRDIRGAGMATPILILTVRNDTVDKVVGLKLGADDYVTKPFEAAELLARIEVLLRRVPIHSGHGTFSIGSIRVDVRQAEVTRDGKPVYLTAREFQLLRYLIERAGKTVPRNELLRSVWGYDSDTLTRTVDTHVASLRQKLEKNPKQPEFIFTVSGVGYKFVGQDSK